MKKIVAIYTGKGLQDPLSNVIAQYPFTQVSIIDDTIIGECVKNGMITDNVKQKLEQYYQSAHDFGADIILNTCSSVGDVAEAFVVRTGLPVVRIDDAMVTYAATHHERIAVIATLPTTLEPTMSLIKRKAASLGKSCHIISGLAEGAFDALVSGDATKHDEIIKNTVMNLHDADCFVLAQASMMRMESALKECTDKPVYSSPRLCLENLVSKVGVGA